MTYFVVDVESDGPTPPLYSMISFGVVVLDDTLTHVFGAKMSPISALWDEKALAISGHTREETLTFETPEVVIPRFVSWVKAHTKKRPIFASDNNGYDFAFMNYYLWRYAGENPFGHSSRNINDLYKGMKGNVKSSFKHLRKTKHTHDPVDDARGNAEALRAMQDLGLVL